jgi:opacity protein-like surface antigen
MKKIILASACMLALASPAAFAQTAQPSGGASSQGNVGPGASQGAIKDGTGTMNQGTTGASRPTGTAKQPDAVQKGVNKQ